MKLPRERWHTARDEGATDTAYGSTVKLQFNDWILKIAKIGFWTIQLFNSRIQLFDSSIQVHNYSFIPFKYSNSANTHTHIHRPQHLRDGEARMIDIGHTSCVRVRAERQIQDTAPARWAHGVKARSSHSACVKVNMDKKQIVMLTSHWKLAKTIKVITILPSYASDKKHQP